MLSRYWRFRDHRKGRSVGPKRNKPHTSELGYHTHLHETDPGGISLHTRAHTAPCIGDPTTTSHFTRPAHAHRLLASCTILTQEGTRENDTQRQRTTRKRQLGRWGRSTQTGGGRAHHQGPTGETLWVGAGRYIANGPRELPNGIILTHRIIPLRTLSRRLSLLSLILSCWYHGHQTTKLRQY